MLFNSYEFIFVFLPAAAIGFYLFGLSSRTLALRWLIMASLVFYAAWRPLNVLIIAPSILINFILARTLQRIGQNADRRPATAVLVFGILFNVGFLGYFKYKNFFLGTINDLSGANFTLTEIILPLGISFITFQKLAFLIDVYGKRIDSFHFQDYCLFVLFFPQLIAGPIVHYRELVPQFRDADGFGKTNVAAGLTLFFLGLFKKVVLADHIAPFVTPIYVRASDVGDITLFPAWMAAIGFTLQIYFDFSGYSDMAMGSAQLFGIRLPVNFNSPLKATSIIDFWARWHVTLTRFLTAYIYNPLLLSLTRRRLAKGHAGLGGRNTTIGAFVGLLMFPTVLTMLISGIWHGAGYTFVVWGLLHGIFLTINHGWRMAAARFSRTRRNPGYLSSLSGFALTFIAVVAAMVFFRSPTIGSAASLVKGMVGLNGIALPDILFSRLGPLTQLLQGAGIGTDPWLGGGHFVQLAGWISALTVIALVFPNTLQFLANYMPALGVKPDPRPGQTSVPRWNPSVAYALLVAAVVTVSILQLGGPSEFLYWQF